jgi:hypothetical protein
MANCGLEIWRLGGRGGSIIGRGNAEAAKYSVQVDVAGLVRVSVT